MHSKQLLLAVLVTASTAVAIPGAAHAMSLETAEKVILKGILKNAERVKNMNVGVYNAAKQGPAALGQHCRRYTGDCIGVALEVALIL